MAYFQCFPHFGKRSLRNPGGPTVAVGDDRQDLFRMVRVMLPPLMDRSHSLRDCSGKPSLAFRTPDVRTPASRFYLGYRIRARIELVEGADVAEFRATGVASPLALRI